jgi:hypothetical protein
MKKIISEIDGRKKKHYSTSEIIERTLAIFFNNEKSFHTVECKERLEEKNPMVSNTLAYFFKKADLNAANTLLFEIFHQAYRSKQLKDFISFTGMPALVIDGTQCFESKIKHCDNCTEVVRNEVTYYQYRLLIASVVNIKTHDTIVVSIEPILNQDGNVKQDCEINAAKRLLERVHSYNRWMRYLIVADGLYAGSPIIEQIKSYKWEAIISLTDERMDLFKVADCRFKNRKKDFFYTESYENNYLWFEKDSLSDFWESLDCSIYVAKRVVEKIKKDGTVKKEEPKLLCFFISTIPLNQKNIRKVNKIHRARWGIENTTINNLKNRFFMKHTFVYKATGIIWIFASLAMNLFTIFMLRNHIVYAYSKMTDEVFRKYIATSLGGIQMFSNLFKKLNL